MGKRGSVPRRIGYAQQRAADDRAREEKLRQLCKNGITPRDMEEACKLAAVEAYRRGKEAAVNEMEDYYMGQCYAAALLATHEIFGFGPGRCRRLMRAMNQQLLKYLTPTEMVEEVRRKMGIEIDYQGWEGSEQ